MKIKVVGSNVNDFVSSFTHGRAKKILAEIFIIFGISS